MKFVVYTLLLANLVIAAWVYSNQDNDHAALKSVDLPSTGTETLQLLAERNRLEFSQSAPARSEASAVPAVVVPTTLDASPPPTSAEIDATASLQNMPAPAPENPAQPSRICHALGPFLEREVVDALAKRLNAQGVKTVMRTMQTDEPSGYWVYLPSMPYANAQRIVADFKAKGVKDYFLGKQNFISLGVFTDKNTAEARSQAIRALGYTPILEPRYQRRDTYWLDADETGDTHMNAAQWLALMADQTAIQRQTVACK